MNEATCYICTIAGKTGFKNYLGVVLDHMFFPNLREDDFLTEVHHVNGKGEDAGTVYSEMQVNMSDSGVFKQFLQGFGILVLNRRLQKSPVAKTHLLYTSCTK